MTSVTFSPVKMEVKSLPSSKIRGTDCFAASGAAIKAACSWVAPFIGTERVRAHNSQTLHVCIFLPTLGWCQGVQNRHIWHSHGVLGIGNAPTQGLRTIVLMTEPVSSLMLSTVFRCPLGNGYIASSPTSCQQMLCLGQAMLFPKCEAFQLAMRHHNMEICGNSTCAPSCKQRRCISKNP